jgi:hypothetical protein
MIVPNGAACLNLPMIFFSFPNQNPNYREILEIHRQRLELVELAFRHIEELEFLDNRRFERRLDNAMSSRDSLLKKVDKNAQSFTAAAEARNQKTTSTWDYSLGTVH